MAAIFMCGRMAGMSEIPDEQHKLIRALIRKYACDGMSIHDSVNRAFREVRPISSWLTSLHTPNTRRNDLARVLARIDRLLVEEEDIAATTDKVWEREIALNLLIEFQEEKRGVEAKLRNVNL
jgi:hypothetical protein